jgi:hypothetical protein
MTAAPVAPAGAAAGATAVAPARTTDRWTAVTAIPGGIAVVVGSALPWLSTLAGLQILTGLDGSNGRILAAGGVVAIALGAASLRLPGRLVRGATGLVGFALLALSSWLLLALLITYRELSADPFALAELRPGLFVATAGAALVFSPLLRGSVAPSGSAPWRLAAPVTLLATASLLAGVLHLALSGEHLADGPLTGMAFVALGIVQIGGSALLVVRPTRRILQAAVALHGGAVLAWALAEAGLLAFLHAGGGAGHHGGIALATVAAQVFVVLGSLHLLSRRR